MVKHACSVSQLRPKEDWCAACTIYKANCPTDFWHREVMRNVSFDIVGIELFISFILYSVSFVNLKSNCWINYCLSLFNIFSRLLHFWPVMFDIFPCFDPHSQFRANSSFWANSGNYSEISLEGPCYCLLPSSSQIFDSSFYMPISSHANRQFPKPALLPEEDLYFAFITFTIDHLVPAYHQCSTDSWTHRAPQAQLPTWWASACYSLHTYGPCFQSHTRST